MAHFEIFVKGKTISYGENHRMKQNHSISSAQQAQDSYQVKFSKMLDDILRGAETTKDSLQRQISQFSSDISHFQYGELRSKRHHRGEERKILKYYIENISFIEWISNIKKNLLNVNFVSTKMFDNQRTVLSRHKKCLLTNNIGFCLVVLCHFNSMNN